MSNKALTDVENATSAQTIPDHLSTSDDVIRALLEIEEQDGRKAWVST